MALAASGNNFVLGILKNTATSVTRLTGDVSSAQERRYTKPGTDIFGCVL